MNPIAKQPYQALLPGAAIASIKAPPVTREHPTLVPCEENPLETTLPPISPQKLPLAKNLAVQFHKDLLVRHYPQGGSNDTLCSHETKSGEIMLYEHGYEIPYIRDDEILRERLSPKDFDQSEGYVDFARLNLQGRIAHVMQQISWRGCTAACAAMLMLDHGVRPDMDWVRSCNISRKESTVFQLKKSGLTPLEKTVSFKNRSELFLQLERMIAENGPGILSVGGEIGGHVIVVDRVFIEDGHRRVTIRDPWHGWCIDISLKALRLRTSNGADFIQIQKH